MRSHALAWATTVLLAGCGGMQEPSPDPGFELGLEDVATGLSFPVFLTSPPGDQDRLFIVEKRGTIRIVDRGTLRAAAFLDLSAEVSTGAEQGLLGLAFHPSFIATGRFVVNYTDRQGDTRVSLFQVAAADRNRADPTTEQVLLAFDQPFANHNGGMVDFGPRDGHLYVGLGDGGSAGDPQGNGQRLGTLLGKMLRLAVSPTGQVSVPGDNPFVGQSGARPEIWSLGLRNPWRHTFDRSTGDLYIADVGQGAREEVDVATAADQYGRGANYGWSVMEGTACFPAGANCNRSGLTLPALEYDHGQGCSITGGYVYRGATIPPLQGTYFYGDYCGGWVRSFRLENGRAVDEREWPTLAPGGQITSFGQDARGELYVLTSSGRVAKIVARQP
jgi:glucose/arabinose dehydrogenase